MNSNSKLAILSIILVQQSQLQREDNFVLIATCGFYFNVIRTGTRKDSCKRSVRKEVA